AVRKYKGIPPYPETKSYIAGIMRSYKKPTISTHSPLYKGYDASGKYLVTTDPSLIVVKKD
ncbi:MAG: transglycosylase SLT domain-containing protein, partial [Candidatus Aminicenantales bacterium]